MTQKVQDIGDLKGQKVQDIDDPTPDIYNLISSRHQAANKEVPDGTRTQKNSNQAILERGAT